MRHWTSTSSYTGAARRTSCNNAQRLRRSSSSVRSEPCASIQSHRSWTRYQVSAVKRRRLMKS
ncbi:hypothetical protein [Lysobacter gummosus]|uniref:hypothetical protein n=1 Tax=Lysobacter gummosus TaxID=262324 RepID=UPI003637F368